MNYEANTNHWKKGDIVIHDADAKENRMLMRVIGYTRDGLCKTRYIEPNQPKKIYTNEIQYLHDPMRFNFDYWAGYPVIASKPTRCPICGSSDIETGLMPQDDELDEKLAEAFGYDAELEYSQIREEHPEFVYVIEEMICDNDECGAVIGYGQRWYWSEIAGNYSGSRPLTPKQQAEVERKAQVEAGQIELPF